MFLLRKMKFNIYLMLQELNMFLTPTLSHVFKFNPYKILIYILNFFTKYEYFLIFQNSSYKMQIKTANKD